MISHQKRIDKYIDGVLSGKILANRLTKLMVQRHLNDLKNGFERGLYFDTEQASVSIDFFESILYHSQGKWAGTNFVLEPFQAFRIWVLFGWMRDDTGGRRFKKSYVEIPRKNGKSTEAAGAALLTYTMDGERGAQIYAAATKKEQARIVFREAQNMVKASSELQESLKVFAHSIIEKDGAGFFHCLSSDTKSMDGLNIHCATVDELHAHATRDIMDLLETATSARVQPLIYAITTAGSNRTSICYEHHELVTRVLEGSLIDDSLFGAIYSIDELDDWHDPQSWYKANPNLGVSKSFEYMQKQFNQAVNNPANLNTFLRLDLNVWTDSATRWITDDRWMEGNKPIDKEKLKGKKCWVGLDLASVEDTTAMVVVFEPDENDERAVLFYTYLPEKTLYTGTRAQFHNYHLWSREGFLTLTNGSATDYKVIIKDLQDLSEWANVQMVGLDRWNSSQLGNDLFELGYKVEGFGQGYKSQNPAVCSVEALTGDAKLIHGGNPVARWQMGNVMMDIDAAGNKKPNKKRSTEKIDLIAAMITAVGISTAPQKNNIPTITII